jgi:predicted HicB family RNase H-like nuclease
MCMWINIYFNGDIMAKKQLSGLVLIKLSPQIHKSLKILCANTGVSMQDSLNKLISQFVTENLPEIQRSN